MNNNENIVWITWEPHRRTSVLAKELGARLCIINESSLLCKIRFIRYLILSIRTVGYLFKKRPRVLIVQNPSIILAFVACIFRGCFKYILIVDRHSNFKLQNTAGLLMYFFHFLSKFTVKIADITIVTNHYLAEIVNKWGGKAFVLPDKIPELSLANPIQLDGQTNVVYVCSFSKDEPVEEVIDAFGRMEDVFLYITGSYNSLLGRNIKKSCNFSNIKFSGFLDERSYQSLMISADLVLVLTKQEHTLTCGAYESIALSKPMVLSNTNTIRGYFSKGAVYCDPNPVTITAAIRQALNTVEKLQEEVNQLKEELNMQWEKDFLRFVNEISRISGRAFF